MWFVQDNAEIDTVYITGKYDEWKFLQVHDDSIMLAVSAFIPVERGNICLHILV